MSTKTEPKDKYLIGLISDTHGRLPQSVSKIFETTDLIIHAGDIGDPEIINSLGKIAPTIAVRGNMDVGQWARQLPRYKTVEINRRQLYVLHDAYQLDIKPDSNSYHVVIYGHTHRPQVDKQGEVLYINPGSAVHPRFGYPPSVALLQIEGDSIKARLIELKK
jgi:putative phosphoesterase